MPDKKSRVRRVYDVAKQVVAQLPKLKNPALIAGRFALSKTYTVALYGLQILSTAPAVLLSINHYSATRSWFYKLGYTVCTDMLPILMLEAARQASWSYFNQGDAPLNDDVYYQQVYYCLDANLTGNPDNDAIQAFLFDHNVSLCTPESMAYSNVSQDNYSAFQWLPESISEPLAATSTALTSVTQWLPDDPANTFLGSDTWARYLADSTLAALTYCLIQLASAIRHLMCYTAPSMPITILQMYFLTELTVRLLTLKLQHYPAIYAPLHPEQKHDIHAGEEIDHRHPVCISNNCTTMRYAKGELRSFLVWILLSSALWLYGTPDRHGLGPTIPILAWMSQFLLDGELILEFRLGDEGMCDRHRMDVYKEQSELSFSLGMFQSLSTWAVSYMLKHFTGMDSSAFNTCVSGLMGALFLCISYHIPITPRNDHQKDAAADDQISKRWATPTSVFRKWIVDFTMGITTAGAKEELKKRARMARERQKQQQKTAQKRRSGGAARAEGRQDQTANELLKAVAFCKAHKSKVIELLDFAPPLMRSLNNFTEDPVAGSYAMALAERLQESIKDFRHGSRHICVQLLRIAPTGLAAPLLSAALKVPQSMAKLILDLLNSQDFRWVLNMTEERLKALLRSQEQDIDIDDLVILAAATQGGTRPLDPASALSILPRKTAAATGRAAQATKNPPTPVQTSTLTFKRRPPAAVSAVSVVAAQETDSDDGFEHIGAFRDDHELAATPKEEPSPMPIRRHYQSTTRRRPNF